MLYGFFIAQQGIVGCVRVLQYLLALCTEPYPGLEDTLENSTALVLRLAGRDQKWCVIFVFFYGKTKRFHLLVIFSASVLQHKRNTGDSYRADFGLHLSEPEEEFQVLQGLVGSHHQRVELLLHLIVQNRD